MVAERRCQKCGAPVADDALFCPRCGMDVTVVGAADASVGVVVVLASASTVVALEMRDDVVLSSVVSPSSHALIARSNASTSERRSAREEVMS